MCVCVCFFWSAEVPSAPFVREKHKTGKGKTRVGVYITFFHKVHSTQPDVKINIFCFVIKNRDGPGI